MANKGSTRQRAILRKYSGNVKMLMALISVCAIVLTLPKQAKFSYDIDKGRIWDQKELVAPYSFAILKSQQEIDNDEKAALASITPIYQLDDELGDKERENFKTDFAVKWHGAGLKERQKNDYLAEGDQVLKEVYSKGIVSLNAKYQQAAENYPVTILNKNVATNSNTADLFTRDQAVAYCDRALTRRNDLDKTF